MLSRVAENLYWFSRYVRRAENMARLLNVSSQLQLDLPRAARFAWRPLVETMGALEAFDRLHKGDTGEPSEEAVVRFLLLEPEYQTSLLSMVRQAREILRTVRETLPQECWVTINDLYLHIESHAERAVQRRYRLELLDRVVDACMRVSALLTANVSRDIGYHFLQLGAWLEQADMTTRIIDSAAAGLIVPRSEEDIEAFRAMQWMSLLQSLAAYQMYRRQLRQRVSIELALQFLLKDREFPRSVYFCLNSMQGILPLMPARPQVKRSLKQSLRLVYDADPHKLNQGSTCDFMDRIQVQLAGLHSAIQESYFLTEHGNVPLSAEDTAA